MRLLDVPWDVNEQAERISTHGGLASVDFNGTERERREAMRLVAQAQEMAQLLLRIRNALKDAGENGIAIETMDRVLRAAGVEVS